MVYYYVSPQAAKNLHKYRYRASDLSLIYNYVLSPLSECLIKLVPPTVSANTLTMCGFLCNLAAYLLCALQCGSSLTCVVSPALIWVCIVCYFGWLILDNMDGKQARRLNCSSPLGLLFDHQVDALNLWMTTTIIGTAFPIGDSSSTVFIWAIGSIPFFFATWEEFYLGSMDFPFINGPNEGCIFIGALLILRTQKETEYFTEVNSWGLNFRQMMIAGFLVAAVINGAWNIFRVLTKSEHKREALESTLSYWYFLTCIFVLYLFSPAELLETETRWVLICIGCAFAKEMALMQTAHVTMSEYQPLGITNFALLTSLMANTLAHRLSFSLIDEVHFLLVLTTISVLTYAHMAYWVAIEISRELKISIFAVPTSSAVAFQLV